MTAADQKPQHEAALSEQTASNAEIRANADIAQQPDSRQPGRSSNNAPSGMTHDVINVVRGFCMGAADTVPGVSGGTVALILGHYQRLIGAIRRIDSDAVSMLFKGKFREAFDYVDGRFLGALGLGIGTGIVTLAGLMHWLLDNRMPETFAVFFGLIIGSAWIVRKFISAWSPAGVIAVVAGAAAAVAIGRLSPTDGGGSLAYLFFSASVAICAMILPGISGAFILLLLGVYHPITGMIKELAKGQVDANALMSLGVFAFGCLFGLLAFSRVLHWLLHKHKDVTMAALIGLMLGSVEKLWPLQMPTPETASLKMKERVMVSVPPGEWDGSLVLLVGLAIGAAVAVLVLERLGEAFQANHPNENVG
ncbi:DUF368 domain-containing protein [Rhodopirellula sp. MGV]|uniref:DUF368 domain-containing protein n=1 Tax=Rhodopirellula sp. MGV TaxID=2023130 RepID=UPI000B971C14|nr:DUF368 domain-containing protein [Rhodopirellula sp. MGV]OYP28945.1 DUF368 domain-containing protein [Rhodopirellula sp. MGV]PNY36938.1 DUF368 domain-containing protein [Rhodopirellula baltica]